jgi:hypothetical protein
MVVMWLPSIETDDAPSSRRNVRFSLISRAGLMLSGAVIVTV